MFAADLAERPGVRRVRQTAVAELERADQRAVHDQVGIAPDRRGEMGIAAQVEAEMAVVLRGVFGLGLAAQHDLIDELLGVAALHPVENEVEAAPAGALRLLGKRDVERRQELAQRVELLQRRLVMDAVDERRVRPLQRLGGRDIGEDHELLDQPMRVEPRRRDHPVDGVVGLEHDLALGQIEIERTRARRGPA